MWWLLSSSRVSIAVSDGGKCSNFNFSSQHLQTCIHACIRCDAMRCESALWSSYLCIHAWAKSNKQQDENERDEQSQRIHLLRAAIFQHANKNTHTHKNTYCKYQKGSFSCVYIDTDTDKNNNSSLRCTIFMTCSSFHFIKCHLSQNRPSCI